MLRIGVVAYGTGGKHFHAPFIQAARGCTLAGVVARADKTIAAVKADLPDQPIYPSLMAMIASGQVDAVAITTPPETRRELVLEAIAAGVHVVADKPFAPDAAGAHELDRAAKAKGVVLGVYQNRRFDSDIQTLSQLLLDRRLGILWRIHSRMDFDDPITLEPGSTGGLLRDLGSHLVDQMLWLLGPAVSVDAQMDHVDLPAGRTDASFTITLRHGGGAHSYISASKLNRLNVRELRAYGEAGSYASQSTDIQAQQLFAGKRPADDPTTWGYEPETHWGTLRTAAGSEVIRAAQGRYHDYYDIFAAAVRNGTPPPVTAEVGARTLAVLDAARQSAQENRSISLEGPHG